MGNFLRVAAAVPEVAVANPEVNAERIVEILKNNKADITVFPELSITGCTCEDLFLQDSLIKSAYGAVREICSKTDELCVVGCPVVIDSKLFNCAIVINNHKIAGIVPQTYCMDYSGASKRRYFSSADELKTDVISSSHFGMKDVYPIYIISNLIFDGGNFKFAVEIGSDMFAPITPGTINALAGADVILNTGAIPMAVNVEDSLKNTIIAHSRADVCAYVYSGAGADESTTEYIFPGICHIAESGKIISSTHESIQESSYVLADIDIANIRKNRIKNFLFKNCAEFNTEEPVIMVLNNVKSYGDGTHRPVSKTPFIPEDEILRYNRCKSIFEMQVAGLLKRAKVTNGKLIVGVSGGLDSTLALLVCAEVSKRNGNEVIGITMPCFGTTGRTYNNSINLMKSLGINYKEINIKKACETHFQDIGHNGELDLTYENTQARERTQVLMDYAGMCGGFVVGTGDLSELVLGWCTYNGDHMSMYGVNSSIPKTLIKSIIETLIKENTFPESNEILSDILATPISPELLPPKDEGDISQVTEDIVGPYILHDFFLYYILRYGYSPKKVFELAKLAFRNDYNKETILKWLKNFYKRFFTQQFKRSCLPDGVKIGSVGVSPRGELKMPSDATAKIWLDEVENIK